MARGLAYLWRDRAPAAVDEPAGVLPSLVTRVLASRGLTQREAIDRFLSPTLHHLHDPSLLPDLDPAAGRLLDAARSGESIVIYGDYDVDGVTASAILARTLRHAAPGCSVRTYIPHRVDEGYGLAADAIRELAGGGARVIVSVDCGVTAVEPAVAARQAGVDLIITDHHALRSDGHMPDAFAIVHPRAPGSRYPFDGLSGAGVAFKLAWRIATMSGGGEKVDAPTRAVLLDLLALAALGTVADVVPLTDENRVIVKHGLSRITSTSIIGLTALIDASRLSGGRISAEDVGFRLAPRLNAVGRLGHAREAVELLLTDDAARAATIAAELDRLNEDRRKLEQAIAKQAEERAIAEGMTGEDCRAIVLADERWHAGVVGIACSRLVERFGRPTLLLTSDGAVCAGSGRSIEGFDLAGALDGCRDLLRSGGGHRMAAGVKVEYASFSAFRDRFIGLANAALTASDLGRSLAIDTDATLDELSVETVRMLERLGPFGAGNPAACVRLRGVRLASNPSIMGKSNAHCAIVVQDDRGRCVRLIGWRWAERAERLMRGMVIDAAVTPRVSSWNDRHTVEPEIVDLRVV